MSYFLSLLITAGFILYCYIRYVEETRQHSTVDVFRKFVCKRNDIDIYVSKSGVTYAHDGRFIKRIAVYSIEDVVIHEAKLLSCGIILTGITIGIITYFFVGL